MKLGKPFAVLSNVTMTFMYPYMLSIVYFSGVLVPGGFGSRGIEGKIAAIQWARLQKKPFLGICLGLQCAVIEFARHVLEYRDANSAEFDHTEHQVVS